jgi:hypothetical protein
MNKSLFLKPLKDLDYFDEELDTLYLSRYLYLLFSSPNSLEEDAELWQLSKVLNLDLTIFFTMLNQNDRFEAIKDLKMVLDKMLNQMQIAPTFWKNLHLKRTIWRDYFIDKRGFRYDLQLFNQHLDFLEKKGVLKIAFWEL